MLFELPLVTGSHRSHHHTILFCASQSEAPIRLFTPDAKKDFEQFVDQVPSSAILLGLKNILAKEKLVCPGMEEDYEPEELPEPPVQVKKELADKKEDNNNDGSNMECMEWTFGHTQEHVRSLDNERFKAAIIAVHKHPLFSEFWQQQCEDCPDQAERKFGDDAGDPELEMDDWICFLKKKAPHCIITNGIPYTEEAAAAEVPEAQLQPQEPAKSAPELAPELPLSPKGTNEAAMESGLADSSTGDVSMPPSAQDPLQEELEKIMDEEALTGPTEPSPGAEGEGGHTAAAGHSVQTKPAEPTPDAEGGHPAANGDSGTASGANQSGHLVQANAGEVGQSSIGGMSEDEAKGALAKMTIQGKGGLKELLKKIGDAEVCKQHSRSNKQKLIDVIYKIQKDTSQCKRMSQFMQPAAKRHCG